MITPFHGLPISKEETDFRLNKDEFEFVLNKTKYRDSTSSSGGVKLSEDTNILWGEQMSRVSNFITDKVLSFTDNVLQIENEFSMSQSWSTINYKNNSFFVLEFKNKKYQKLLYIFNNIDACSRIYLYSSICISKSL